MWLDGQAGGVRRAHLHSTTGPRAAPGSGSVPFGWIMALAAVSRCARSPAATRFELTPQEAFRYYVPS